MKPFRKEAQFILMFFVFLTIFTIYSNLGIDPETPAMNPMKSRKVDFAELNPAPSRTPAAINEVIAPILNKEFLCKPSAKRSRDKVGKQLVMISFRMCKDVKAIINMALENQSNGFKAQIFKVEKNKFKTDFIQLNEGINNLKLEVILKDGQKLAESLEIVSGS